MSEKSCDTCLYQNPFDTGECLSEMCEENMNGWRARGDAQSKKGGYPLKKSNPESNPHFSLDKLIDDHWQYNKGLMGYCLPYGVDGWETDDILRLVEFAYKQSGKHFWKHCKEHYNIKDTDNE